MLKKSDPSVGVNNILLSYDLHYNLISSESQLFALEKAFLVVFSPAQVHIKCFLPPQTYGTFQERENLMLKCCFMACECSTHSSVFQNGILYVGRYYNVLNYSVQRTPGA